MIRADDLLEIFRTAKKDRGDFTYEIISQANKSPAEQSIKNASTFFKRISTALEE